MAGANSNSTNSSSENSSDQPTSKFIANHPCMKQIDVIEELMEQLSVPNLSAEEKNSILAKIDGENVELWKTRMLFNLQHFTGELGADFDVHAHTAAELDNNPKIYDLFKHFFAKYCYLYNYFYNNVEPHYTQHIDPELIIPKMITETLDKTPINFTRESAENVVFFFYQEQVINQLRAYHRLQFEFFQKTGQTQPDEDEEASFVKLKEQNRDWVEGYQPPNDNPIGAWLSKMFGKLVGAGD